MRVRLKHIKRVTAKGRTYFYHRLTGERLPDDPRSQAFALAVIRANDGVGAELAASPARGKAKRPSCFLYFIQAGESGPVKIGIAADTAERLATLQIGSPSALRLLGSVPGDSSAEILWHYRFREQRIRGEWFAPSAQLLAAIAEAVAEVAL